MTIAICDEVGTWRAMLFNTIADFIEKIGTNFTIISYNSAEHLLFDVETERNFDLVFMNVDDDFSNIRNLRENGYFGKTVITAKTNEYAVDGYDSDVNGYILKPYSKDKIEKLLNRVTQDENDDYYIIHSNRRFIRVAFEDVMFIESDNAKCYFHLKNGEIYYEYNKLDVLENVFSNCSFLRCHKSFLVNMNFVEKMNDNFIMKDGSSVLIRTRQVREIKNIYLDYNSRN